MVKFFYYIVLFLSLSSFSHAAKTMADFEKIRELEQIFLKDAGSEYTAGLQELDRIILIGLTTVTPQTHQPALYPLFLEYCRACLALDGLSYQQIAVFENCRNAAAMHMQLETFNWDNYEALVQALAISCSNYKSNIGEVQQNNFPVLKELEHLYRNRWDEVRNQLGVDAERIKSDYDRLHQLTNRSNEKLCKFYAHEMARTHHGASPVLPWPAYIFVKDGHLGLYTVLKAYYFGFIPLGLTTNRSVSVHANQYVGPSDFILHDFAHAKPNPLDNGQSQLKRMSSELDVLFPAILLSGGLDDIFVIFMFYHEKKYNNPMTKQDGSFSKESLAFFEVANPSKLSDLYMEIGFRELADFFVISLVDTEGEYDLNKVRDVCIRLQPYLEKYKVILQNVE